MSTQPVGEGESPPKKEAPGFRPTLKLPNSSWDDRQSGRGCQCHHGGQTVSAPGIIERIRKCLGEDVVLLAVKSGAKIPAEAGWQTFTADKMNDPAYLATLNHGCNIGVLLGQNSGGLCTNDVDDDDRLKEFLALKPKDCRRTPHNPSQRRQCLVANHGRLSGDGEVKDPRRQGMGGMAGDRNIGALQHLGSPAPTSPPSS